MAAEPPRPGAEGRRATSLTLAAAAGGLALVGAWLTPGSVGAINQGVEALSSGSSGALDRLASWLPLGFAFGAGLVSAVNPCGFAMLPAYLGLYLRGDAGPDHEGGVAGGATPGARLRRALTVGVTVTAGFVALFGVVGLLIGAGLRSLAGAFPWIGLSTGLLLIGAGAWSWGGGAMYSRLGERLSHVVPGVRAGGLRGYLAFGVAYGLASLSCTLPVFLAVLGSASTLTAAPQAGLQVLLYGAGMGTVITVLTVALALFRGALLDRARRGVRWVGPASSALMLVAGAYIVYYWLTIGGLLPG
jgi:cytochrome c biogenesis protein CcdA